MTTMPNPLATTVVRERTLDAAPHAVYRAWLDPAVLCRWLAPGAPEFARAEVEERVGGRIRIRQTDGSDQPVRGFEGELLELVPDERLVLRWGFLGPDPEAGPLFDSLLTVTLAPTAGGGTRLTIHHEQLEALAAALPEVAEQVPAGWDAVLGRLAGLGVAS
jgi:uncharacterized protein YndB with AHSA1/START domain